MNARPLLIVNTILIAGMAGASLWFAPSIAEDARLPMHWGLDGTVDGYGSKWEALLAMPLVAAGVTLLLIVLPYLDPRRKNIEQSGKLWNAAAISVVLFLAMLHAFLISNAIGQPVDMRNVIIPGVAGLFIILGNYLGKSRSNWFAGVRTPWTMSSDYSWEKTHRWTGRLFVAGGLATLAAWFLIDAKIAFIVMIASIGATTIAAFVMSYIFWKNDPNRAAGA